MLRRIKKKMNHTELCKLMTKKLKEESIKKMFAGRENFQGRHKRAFTQCAHKKICVMTKIDSCVTIKQKTNLIMYH